MGKIPSQLTNQNSIQLDANANIKLPGKRSGFSLREFEILAFTEIFILGGFFVPLFFNATGVLFLAIGLGLVASYEILKLMVRNTVLRVSGALILVGLFVGSVYLPPMIKIGLAFLLLALLLARLKKQYLGLLILYPLFFASFLPNIYRLENGLTFIIFAYIVTETCDSIALLAGKIFGRIKPFKSSPNKSLEGLIAGIIFGTLAGTVFGHLNNWPFPNTGLIAFFFSLTTILGDLVASHIKRQFKVKDFGSVLPYQGGILDIYDSILFNIPILFALLTFIPQLLS